MANKGSAARDMSRIARPKPPKVLQLGGKHKASFIARARQQAAKLKERHAAHAK